MLFRSTGPLALSLLPSGGVIKDWRVSAEAMLLAVLIGSAALMSAEPLISVTGGVERGDSAQQRGGAMPESREMPRK